MSSRTSTQTDRIADALRATLISPNESDANYEPANAVDAIAQAGRNIARALDRLGNGDACTHMGGLEAHGKAILDASDKIAAGLHAVADAIVHAVEDFKR